MRKTQRVSIRRQMRGAKVSARIAVRVAVRASLPVVPVPVPVAVPVVPVPVPVPVAVPLPVSLRAAARARVQARPQCRPRALSLGRAQVLPVLFCGVIDSFAPRAPLYRSASSMEWGRAPIAVFFSGALHRCGSLIDEPQSAGAPERIKIKVTVPFNPERGQIRFRQSARVWRSARKMGIGSGPISLMKSSPVSR